MKPDTRYTFVISIIFILKLIVLLLLISAPIVYHNNYKKYGGVPSFSYIGLADSACGFHKRN